MTLCNLPQIYTDGIFIKNHVVMYVVKQFAQQLIFLVPVMYSGPFSGKVHLLLWISSPGFSISLRNFFFPPTQLVRAYDTIKIL